MLDVITQVDEYRGLPDLLGLDQAASKGQGITSFMLGYTPGETDFGAELRSGVGSSPDS